MALSNLPDDWGSYYSTCSECGERYHLSGTETCACAPCDGCGDTFPPDVLIPVWGRVGPAGHDYYCPACYENELALIAEPAEPSCHCELIGKPYHTRDNPDCELNQGTNFGEVSEEKPFAGPA